MDFLVLTLLLLLMLPPSHIMGRLISNERFCKFVTCGFGLYGLLRAAAVAMFAEGVVGDLAA